jgi:schlafen family protein
MLPGQSARSALRTPFGASWDALTLDTMRAFFAEAGDEGLTWEAKGTDIRREHVIEAASAFGNSLQGGYLVLGARQAKKGGPWTVDGSQFRGEPKAWVSTTLMGDTVRPRPSFDVEAWPIDDERHLAVVSIRPVAVPPVITNNGQVWERLSGLSKQVQDPSQMRALVRRGEQAMAEAQRIAEGGRHDLMAVPPKQRRSSIIVSMASPALIGDVSPVVFRRSSYQAALDVLNGPLGFPAISGYRQNRVGGDIGQGAITLFNASFSEEEGYGIRIGRHGSVSVGQSAAIVEDGLRAVADGASALLRTWEAAAELILAFAGEAPVHAAVALGSEKFGWTEMARWTQVPGPWDDDLAALMRDARRTLGRDEWEPEL